VLTYDVSTHSLEKAAVMAAVQQHHLGKFPEESVAPKARAHERLILAEVFGYYGLLGAAAITTIFLH
jgi:hypothetical protein